jgi:hypothetical protein
MIAKPDLVAFSPQDLHFPDGGHEARPRLECREDPPQCCGRVGKHSPSPSDPPFPPGRVFGSIVVDHDLAAFEGTPRVLGDPFQRPAVRFARDADLIFCLGRCR